MYDLRLSAFPAMTPPFAHAWRKLQVYTPQIAKTFSRSSQAGSAIFSSCSE